VELIIVTCKQITLSKVSLKINGAKSPRNATAASAARSWHCLNKIGLMLQFHLNAFSSVVGCCHGVQTGHYSTRMAHKVKLRVTGSAHISGRSWGSAGQVRPLDGPNHRQKLPAENPRRHHLTPTLTLH